MRQADVKHLLQDTRVHEIDVEHPLQDSRVCETNVEHCLLVADGGGGLHEPSSSTTHAGRRQVKVPKDAHFHTLLLWEALLLWTQQQRDARGLMSSRNPRDLLPSVQVVRALKSSMSRKGARSTHKQQEFT
eukprot:1142088-Pelagomonas_calceolata.AAC.8